MANKVLIYSAALAVFIVAVTVAYMTGLLDPVIKETAFYFMKTKAKAEEKKLEAQGLKEGEDFLKSDLKGNQQANDIKENFGNLGGLKAGL